MSSPRAFRFVTSSATHYDLLGVPPAASGAEVRAAYRRLAVRYHPDKHYGNPHFEELFKQVAEAYRVLSDPARRAAYDAVLLAGRQRQATMLRQQRQTGATPWPVGHRYHYATTRPPAAVRERAYHTVQQRAQFNRRDRRILLVLLIFLTTAAGAVAMWRDARSEAHADEVYLDGMLALKRGDWAAAMTNWTAAIREEPTHGAA
ncbi:MAG: DnaJ domain-containing protein, partial [Hymenobacteraceae bacterium]|nr:DnaJ domain-containing protein [Hymenobacteraceae bacterium]